MHVTHVGQAKQELKALENDVASSEADIADRVTFLLGKFPELLSDASFPRSLIDRMYSKKDHFTQDTQKKIAALFQKVHKLAPTLVQGVSQRPAKELCSQYSSSEALVADEQEYPVPIAFLAQEEMSSQDYFSTLHLELGDGSRVNISQGLLAKFSDMARLMFTRKDLQKPHSIHLDFLNKHQCDLLFAFLETSREFLINEENVIPLMKAASFLQIPHLMEACRQCMMDHMDIPTLVELINSSQGPISFEIEQVLSQEIQKALLQDDVLLTYMKEHLIQPIHVDLSGLDITDEILSLLVGLPISELHLLDCQNLTRKALSIIGRIPTCHTLKLGGNNWVDDAALGMVPDTVKSLSLSSCKQFTGQGLTNLQRSHVIDLDLFGCDQLQDSDYQELPLQLVSLDLRHCKSLKERAAFRLHEMELLQRLVLADANVTSHLIAALPKQLLFLDLSGAKCALDPLREFVKLQELVLCSAHVSDKSLSSIPEQIETLRLDRCLGVQDAGLHIFLNRPTLRYLGLHGCPKVTYVGVDLFAKTKVNVGWQEPQASHLAIKALSV